MPAGLIGTGQFQNEQTQRTFAELAQREQERNAENTQVEAAKKQSLFSAIGTGAGIGASFGPGGAAIGAGIGLIAGSLF